MCWFKDFVFGQGQASCLPQVHGRRDILIFWTWPHTVRGFWQMVAAHCASISRWVSPLPPLCCSGFTQMIPPTRFSPQAMQHAYYCNIMLSHESGWMQYEKQTRSCCYGGRVCVCVCVCVCFRPSLVSISWTVVRSSLFVQLLVHPLPGSLALFLTHSLTRTHRHTHTHTHTHTLHWLQSFLILNKL